ncbi:hypothetical protein K501DRAFT_28468 [Backusella circina FSU 941]|nr:hypothetical protein K501DRAFT_28468 [Backusella circina FSU 941]
MEPGKVRALALNGQNPDILEPSTSSSSEGSSHEENTNILPSDRRRITIDLAEKKRLSLAQREFKRRKLQEELEGYEEDEEMGQAKTPRLSLPLNVESLANRHNQHVQNKLTTTIPIHAPSQEMKEQIKARFSIGQIEDNHHLASSKPTPVSSRLSLTSSSSSSPIKRKRRLTGNLLKPSPIASPSISSSNNNTSSSIKNESIPVMVAPLPTPKPTIVFTSMAPALRKQCMEMIKQLGKLELASNVDDRTTHVLCKV